MSCGAALCPQSLEAGRAPWPGSHAALALSCGCRARRDRPRLPAPDLPPVPSPVLVLPVPNPPRAGQEREKGAGQGDKGLRVRGGAGWKRPGCGPARRPARVCPCGHTGGHVVELPPYLGAPSPSWNLLGLRRSHRVGGGAWPIGATTAPARRVEAPAPVGWARVPRAFRHVASYSQSPAGRTPSASFLP